jgi:hypothetical protein
LKILPPGSGPRAGPVHPSAWRSDRQALLRIQPVRHCNLVMRWAILRRRRRSLSPPVSAVRRTLRRPARSRGSRG